MSVLESIKIKIHSIADLITNSSSIIYTYSNDSAEACKNVVNEFLKVLGSDKSCDDLFIMYVSPDTDRVIDYISEHYDEDTDSEDETWKDLPKCFEKMDYKKKARFIESTLESVASGAITEPTWLAEAAAHENYDGYSPPTDLVIIPRKPEYKKIADLLVKFLYSTDHEASYG